jgi:hypothetical protein
MTLSASHDHYWLSRETGNHPQPVSAVVRLFEITNIPLLRIPPGLVSYCQMLASVFGMKPTYLSNWPKPLNFHLGVPAWQVDYQTLFGVATTAIGRNGLSTSLGNTIRV